MALIDRDRTAVYAAEDQWSAALDRGGSLDFFGSAIRLPTQLRFGDLAAMQAYIVRCTDAFPDAGPVRVRRRRGQTKAHYAAGVIAIPIEQWACREAVLLHEFAHHVHHSRADDGADAPHGAGYRAVMHEVVETMLGSEAALLLRTCWVESGVGHVA